MKKIHVRPTYKFTVLLLLLVFSAPLFAQTKDSTQKTTHLSAFVGVTNNGISFIPTFSFDKPAGTVIFSVGGKRLSFEPDFRFTLDMNRGGVAFWWRYKLIMRGKFNLRVGAHPALNLIPLHDAVSGEETGTLEAQRFVAGEFAPSYALSKNVSLGVYYMQGHGFQDNAPKNIHFLTLNSSISNITLFSGISLQLSPQIYYLAVDDEDGFYFTNTLSLAKANFPLMVQSTINKTIETNITGSKNFQWDVSLVYYFNKEFVPLGK